MAWLVSRYGYSEYRHGFAVDPGFVIDLAQSVGELTEISRGDASPYISY